MFQDLPGEAFMAPYMLAFQTMPADGMDRNLCDSSWSSDYGLDMGLYDTRAALRTEVAILIAHPLTSS
jgi:hypothetical protein